MAQEEISASRNVVGFGSKSFTASSPLHPKANNTSSTSPGSFVGSTASESPGSNVIPDPVRSNS